MQAAAVLTAAPSLRRASLGFLGTTLSVTALMVLVAALA